jgi:uncharacterized protein
MSAKKFRVLAIDGGGMRGIIPGEVLMALESKLRERSGRKDAKIADYFDLIAGTSSGGIFACLYLCPERRDSKRARYTAQEVSNLLLHGGDKIFNISLWQKIRSLGGLTDERYPVEELNDILRGYLGRTRLSDLVKPCLVTAYDMQHRHAFFFAQHVAAKNKQADFYACDVARATSAAPSFFEVANIKSLSGKPYTMIDGGLFASNPSLCAYVEAHRFPSRPTARDLLFVSLGTGQVVTPYAYAQVQHWGIFDWLKPLLDVFMSGEAETVDYQLRHIFAAESVPDQYLRVNPLLGPECSPDLDNACKDNLLALQACGLKTVLEHNAELDRMAGLLIKAGEREQKSRR